RPPMVGNPNQRAAPFTARVAAPCRPPVPPRPVVLPARGRDAPPRSHDMPLPDCRLPPLTPPLPARDRPPDNPLPRPDPDRPPDRRRRTRPDPPDRPALLVVVRPGAPARRARTRLATAVAPPAAAAPPAASSSPPAPAVWSTVVPTAVAAFIAPSATGPAGTRSARRRGFGSAGLSAAGVGVAPGDSAAMLPSSQGVCAGHRGGVGVLGVSRYRRYRDTPAGLLLLAGRLPVCGLGPVRTPCSPRIDASQNTAHQGTQRPTPVPGPHQAQAERDAANGEPGEQDNVHTDGTLPGVGQSLTLTGGRGLSSGHRGPPNQWVSRWPAIPATIRAMPAS